MLRAAVMVKALLLACAAIRATADTWSSASQEERDVPSRSKMLMMVSGSSNEDKLFLERCSQSSVQESCVFAIDHDINQQPWSNECAMTTSDMRPWFEARLEHAAYVSKVQLFGLDLINDRGRDALTDFDLIVGAHVCVRYRSYSSFLNKTIACDTFGDYVRVQSHMDHAVLALCEVVVYGKSVQLAMQENGFSQLRISSCIASSVDKHQGCHQIMDGNRNQDANKGFCAVTDFEEETEPYFEVKLASAAIIRGVRLYNRADCCQDQMINFEISVNGQLCYRYDQTTAFSVKEFMCGRFGNIVRITNTKSDKKKVFVLCEMELYGYPIRFNKLSNYNYLGCFEEKKRDRDLQKLTSLNRMSTEKCERICRRLKKPFFGTQQGKQCWCSDRYGIYGQVEESECWMTCDNNDRQTCGGKLRNNVYAISDGGDEL